MKRLYIKMLSGLLLCTSMAMGSQKKLSCIVDCTGTKCSEDLDLALKCSRECTKFVEKCKNILQTREDGYKTKLEALKILAYLRLAEKNEKDMKEETINADKKMIDDYIKETLRLAKLNKKTDAYFLNLYNAIHTDKITKIPADTDFIAELLNMTDEQIKTLEKKYEVDGKFFSFINKIKSKTEAVNYYKTLLDTSNLGSQQLNQPFLRLIDEMSLSKEEKERIKKYFRGKDRQVLANNIESTVPKLTSLAKKAFEVKEVKIFFGSADRLHLPFIETLSKVAATLLRTSGRYLEKSQNVATANELLARTAEESLQKIMKILGQIDAITVNRSTVGGKKGDSLIDKVKSVISPNAWSGTIEDILDRVYIKDNKADREQELTVLKKRLKDEKNYFETICRDMQVKILSEVIRSNKEILEAPETLIRWQKDIKIWKTVVETLKKEPQKEEYKKKIQETEEKRNTLLSCLMSSKNDKDFPNFKNVWDEKLKTEKDNENAKVLKDLRINPKPYNQCFSIEQIKKDNVELMKERANILGIEIDEKGALVEKSSRVESIQSLTARVQELEKKVRELQLNEKK